MSINTKISRRLGKSVCEGMWMGPILKKAVWVPMGGAA